MNACISSRGRHALVIALALFFSLTACYVPESPIVEGTPPPFSCARLTESHWAEFRFGVDSPDDVSATVSRLWHIDKDQIHFQPLVKEKLLVTWPGDTNVILNARYSALFREERQLTKVDVRWDRSRLPPTLAQVIDCLGFPQYYEAVYTPGAGEAPYQLRLALWYTKKGLVVIHESFHHIDQLPAIHLKQQMNSFTVVAPGDLEQMVPNAYTIGDDPDVQAYGLCVLKPWPGSIEATEVESLRGRNPRCSTE